MDLGSEFSYMVGDYVCLNVSRDIDPPPRLQVIGRFIVETMDGVRRGYHLRDHSAYNSSLLEVSSAEIAAYPDDGFLQARRLKRDIERAENAEAVRVFREKRQKERDSQ